MQQSLQEAQIEPAVSCSNHPPHSLPSSTGLVFAVIKALIIANRSPALTSSYMQLLLATLPHAPRSFAHRFAGLLAPNDLLSKANHCVVSGLYKQRTFSQLVLPSSPPSAPQTRPRNPTSSSPSPASCVGSPTPSSSPTSPPSSRPSSKPSTSPPPPPPPSRPHPAHFLRRPRRLRIPPHARPGPGHRTLRLAHHSPAQRHLARPAPTPHPRQGPRLSRPRPPSNSPARLSCPTAAPSSSACSLASMMRGGMSAPRLSGAAVSGSCWRRTTATATAAVM
ncbi:hypothetical protein MRB53_039952 [Persea americana]|nr:hypothetical protein MRB53_039952 [Persea americana]